MRDGNAARAGWTTAALVLTALCVGWSGVRTMVERFTQGRQVVIVLCGRELPVSYQGFFKQLESAGAGLLEQVLGALRPRLRRLAGVRWQQAGWVPIAVDGSRFDLPRSRGNEQAFALAGRERSGPQLWATLLTHLPTGAIWSWRQGAGTASERHHLREMLSGLPKGSLLVGDAGFVGYGLLRELMARNQAFLVRLGGNVTLRTLGFVSARLARESRRGLRTYLWPANQMIQDEPALALRLIVLKSKGQKVYLATNVLDSQRLPRSLAGELYRMRWGIEVTHRHLKQTLERRKLRCGRPAHALLELAGNILALATLVLQGLLLLQSAADRLSVSAALRSVRQAMEGLTWGRCWTGFAAAMRSAVGDTYHRKAAKTRRPWPSKKKDRPPCPPQLRPFRQEEIAHLLACGWMSGQTG